MTKKVKRSAKDALAPADDKVQSASISESRDTRFVAELAYQYWEEDGRRDGEADSHWLRAEGRAGIPFS